jgi:hypothetical protein
MKSTAIILTLVLNTVPHLAQAYHAPIIIRSDVRYYSVCENNSLYSIDEKGQSALKEDCESKSLTCYDQVILHSDYTVAFGSCLNLQN